jgi:hypothetical protein
VTRFVVAIAISIAIASSARPAVEVGAIVDREPFRVGRALEPQKAGLAVLPLDADALARSHALADLRIIDAKGRQVPYIVERHNEPIVVELKLPPRSSRGTSSVYTFELPYESLPAGTKLVLHTDDRVFRREVSLRIPAGEQSGRGPFDVATEMWNATDPAIPAQPLIFDLQHNGLRSIEAEIDEGDNAPLQLRSAEILLPAFALRFVNPGGPLTLLYDNPAAIAPRYDLELLATRLRSQPAREVGFSSHTAPLIPSREKNDSAIFWIAIGAAVVALLAILARMLRP